MTNRKLPHIIIENGTEYYLGKLKGNHIFYDFESILFYLSAKGKMLFGAGFKLYEEDRDILYKLAVYFIRDVETCKSLGIDLYKGILLTGPVGCGKTSMMKLFRYILPHLKSYKMVSCRNAVFSFNHLGYKVIEDYGDKGHYCFDDLGIEPVGRYYGQDCNVMGEILLSRYELLLQSASFRTMRANPYLTHATTNLNAGELEERYGNRVRSRMRELWNLIPFDTSSKDKRT